MAGTPTPHLLLARALSSLAEDEQAIVLRALLPVPAFGAHNAGWISQATAASAALSLGHEREVAASYLPQSAREGETGRQAPLLVRLPPALHAELKAWAEANGHSMNAVAVGLIERFLRSQIG